MASHTPSRRGVPVLCIEDEEELRLDLVEELEDAGFAVDAAATGEAGLELFAAGSYALILCDIRLPGMSGIDVLSKVRAAPDRSATPFIVMSAYNDLPLRHDLAGACMSAFLVKPVDYQDLLQQILSLLPPSH